MTITKQLLEAKLAEACALRDRRQQELNAAIGAINTLEHLLAVCDLEDAPPAPSKDPVPLPSPPGR